MRHPKILYRPMFSTKGSSSYGKGIASNLVTEEQRVKYNSGGRVGYQSRGYVDVGYPWQYPVFPTRFSSERKIPTLPGGITPILSPGKRGDPYTLIQDYGFTEEEDPLREKRDYISVRGDDERIRTLKNAPKYQESDFAAELEAERAQDLELAEAGANEDFPYKTPNDRFENTAGDWRKDLAIPGTVRDTQIEQDYEKGEHYPLTPDSVVEEDTETLTVDPFGFLDDHIAKKKKLGRGKALMDAAAAAMEWSGAGTKKEKAAAISKGLKGVGETATKFQGEAMDLKTKAKMLTALEEVKGEQKQKLFADRLKGYYEPSLKLQEETLELKKEASQLAEKGASPKEIYQSFQGKGVLTNPRSKADILSGLIGKEIYVASDDEEVKQFSTDENDGLIFMDTKGKIWRNTKGEVKSVDIWQDTEFFGE